MENNLLKALLKGIPCGLLAALVFLWIRTMISGTSFTSNIGSLYGILTLICLPLAAVLGFYYQDKRKK